MMLTGINFVLSGVLWWTCFCRIVRTDERTHVAVRVGFCALATAAAISALAPLGVLAEVIAPHPPDPVQILLLVAMVSVQALTARYWRDGVPVHLQRAPRDLQGD